MQNILVVNRSLNHEKKTCVFFTFLGRICKLSQKYSTKLLKKTKDHWGYLRIIFETKVERKLTSQVGWFREVRENTFLHRVSMQTATTLQYRTTLKLGVPLGAV